MTDYYLKYQKYKSKYLSHKCKGYISQKAAGDSSVGNTLKDFIKSTLYANKCVFSNSGNDVFNYGDAARNDFYSPMDSSNIDEFVSSCFQKIVDDAAAATAAAAAAGRGDDTLNSDLHFLGKVVYTICVEIPHIFHDICNSTNKPPQVNDKNYSIYMYLLADAHKQHEVELVWNGMDLCYIINVKNVLQSINKYVSENADTLRPSDKFKKAINIPFHQTKYKMTTSGQLKHYKGPPPNKHKREFIPYMLRTENSWKVRGSKAQPEELNWYTERQPARFKALRLILQSEG